jgi:hypothetical protein
MEATRQVDNDIYSRKALAAAREAFASYCTVWAIPGQSGTVAITVSVRPEFERDARQVVLEFWNYFLDSSCQLRLEKESD